MILDFITRIFKQVTEFIDDSTLSPEEKKKLEIQLISIQNEMNTKIAEIKGSIILAEARGNWYQRSWRPSLVMGLLGLLYLHCLGLLANPLPAWFGTLFTSLVTVFAAGRTIEKAAPNFRKN